jgi:predicted Rdx family selenoprotein
MPMIVVGVVLFIGLVLPILLWTIGAIWSRREDGGAPDIEARIRQARRDASRYWR